MCHVEKICRKIKPCRIPFPPEASIWIQRVQVYYSLLQFHKGWLKNCGILKRTARCCYITNPLSLTIADILEQLKACKTECAFYQDHGNQICKKHLNDCLSIAQDQEDTSEVQNKMIFMGHQISSCHVLVVRSFFILCKMLLSSWNLPCDHLLIYTNIIFQYPKKWPCFVP